MERRRKMEPLVLYYQLHKADLMSVQKATIHAGTTEKCLYVPGLVIVEREYWRKKLVDALLDLDEEIKKLIRFVPKRDLDSFLEYSLHLNTSSGVLVVTGTPKSYLKKFMVENNSVEGGLLN